MSADRPEGANRWLLVGLGLAFLVLTAVATATNDAAVPFALLQASVPFSIALAVIYLGATYSHTYTPAELRTIVGLGLLGFAGMLVMAVWIRLNVSLAPARNLSPGIAVVTVTLVGAGAGLAIGWLTARRNRREREFRETSRQLEAVLATVEAAIFIKDTDGRYQLMNGACKDLLGLDRDESVGGRTDYDLFPDDVAEQFRDDDRRVIERGQTLRREEVVPTHEGEGTYLTLKSPLTDDEGETVGVCAVSTEISERKRREHELEARSAAMEASIDGVALLDADGEYTFVNQAHVDVYGYDDAEAFLGESWRMCYGEEELARFEDEVLPTLAEEGAWRGEAVGRQMDGATFPQELSLTTLDDGGMVCVVRDISERKSYERELERQNERLDTFAEMVSHDLRSPLSVAEGHLQLAQEEGELTHLEGVERSIGRMEDMIGAILTMARSGNPVSATEAIELDALAEACRETIETEQARVVVETNQRVRADRSRLRQLIENLFRNAVDHVGEDVTITVGELEAGFYVADDGPGIAEDDRESVFDWGFSTADDGTGFGLTIVEELARAHGWTVSVTESEDGGARFEVTGVDVLGS